MKIKTQMKITISSTYQVETDFQILGYIGETNVRTINITQPNVENADTYRLRFEYKDGTIYDVPIENNQITITASLLREVGIIKCQWLATKTNGDTYELVAKSQIFDLKIEPSIGDDVAPIPTYEQAQSMLDQLNEGINSKITEPQVEGKAGQVLVSDGQGGAKWDDVEGVGYDDTEVRELIADNAEAITENVQAIADNTTAIESLDGSKADKSEIPTALSELDNDGNFVTDSNYQHTDNNYTSTEKQKLAGLFNYDDSEIRALIDQKATTADIASYINVHKSELKGDDGVSVTNTKVNNNGELVVTLSDDTTINAGHVVGTNGTDGVSVTNAEKNSAGELVLSFSNGESINVGKVVGEKGDTGERGSDGYTPVRGVDYMNTADIAAFNAHSDNYIDTKFAEAEQDISNSVRRAEQAANSASQSAVNAEATKAEVETIVYEDVVGDDMLVGVEMTAHVRSSQTEQEDAPFITENYDYIDSTENYNGYLISDAIEMPNGRYIFTADRRCYINIDLYNPYMGCYDNSYDNITSSAWKETNGRFVYEYEFDEEYEHNYVRLGYNIKPIDWQSYGIELRPITKVNKIEAINAIYDDLNTTLENRLNGGVTSG